MRAEPDIYSEDLAAAQNSSNFMKLKKYSSDATNVNPMAVCNNISSKPTTTNIFARKQSP